MTDMLSRATFTGDFLYDERGRLHAFDGYTGGKVWNGWQCPYFTVDGMRQLASFLKKLNDGDEEMERIDEDKAGAFRLRDASHSDEDDHVIEPKPHRTVDGRLLLYYMGGSWAWDITD